MQQTNRIRDAVVEWVRTHDCDCGGPKYIRISLELYKTIREEARQEMSDKEREYLNRTLPYHMTCITTIFGDIRINPTFDLNDFDFEIHG